ncbi:hypothetical protein [Mycobacterium intracellulare]|uniref:hypothetical protein n=1 Tax=Mycobacterium intracellulare TaxID=1767 RepID=UPI0006CAA912|nr:hypothetical protein [Mycobacterium intracellulare]KPN46539.1 hypothetical protein AN933_25850 [Mycobacterium intracellulare subsp. chimaera]
MTDPTNLIDSPDRAEMLAHAMLRLAPDPSPRIWQLASEPTLAVLLYAASPSQAGGGMTWVNSIVAALADTDRDGLANISNPATHRILRHLEGLTQPQRTSVIATLRAAVTPWLAA